jgi:hypothetical protein
MAKTSLSLASLARATAVHVALAFAAMGGWTLFANRAHGEAAILPALAQGALSAIITLVLKTVLERLTARMAAPLAYVVPPLITATTILAVLVGVHWAIGTPEIAATIAVPWSVSTFYAVVYTAVLVRGRNGQA